MIPLDDLVDVGILAEPELPIRSVAYYSDTQEPAQLTHIVHFIALAEGFDDGVHARSVFCTTATDNVVHIEEN